MPILQKPYNCPLSMDPPRVPVITNEGTTYDFIWIAKSLLRENTNNYPDFNPALDPNTHRTIDTLIYCRSTKELNDSLMDEVLPLSNEEKNEMASLYTRLINRYPALNIRGLHTLEGMQALIGTPRPRLDLQFDFVDPDGRTSIYIAALEGLVNVVRQLLTRTEVNPNQGTTLARLRGSTPLIVAAKNGREQVVKALLASPRVDPNQANEDGETALFIAVQEGHVPVIRVLLANPNVDPNQANTKGETPLFIAIQKQIIPYSSNSAISALLASPRVNSHLATAYGATPLYTAVLLDPHYDIVRYLLKHQNAETTNNALYEAAEDGHPCVRVLLSDETIRDYYLNQIIKKPEFMRDALSRNAYFFTKLAKYRNELWASLREPAHLNLQPDEHKALLRAILDSRQEPNETLRHPLYTLFSTPQPQGRFSFFSRTTNITLDDIQAHTDATYPQPRP